MNKQTLKKKFNQHALVKKEKRSRELPLKMSSELTKELHAPEYL